MGIYKKYVTPYLVGIYFRADFYDRGSDRRSASSEDDVIDH